jgi:transposase
VRKKREPISDVLRGQIELFTRCGATGKTIAKIFNIHRATVSVIQTELGLGERPTPAPVPVATIEKIRAMYKEFPGYIIAKELKMPASHVYKILRAFDATRPPKRGGRRSRFRRIAQAQKSLIRSKFIEFKKEIAAEFGISFRAVHKFLRG